MFGGPHIVQTPTKFTSLRSTEKKSGELRTAEDEPIPLAKGIRFLRAQHGATTQGGAQGD